MYWHQALTKHSMRRNKFCERKHVEGAKNKNEEGE